jgi:hypothetical protein
LTAATPVERIVELLTGAGYRRLATPIEVAGLKFDFPAALLGTGASSDLIVVVDTAFETVERAKNRIESISRALDVVESKRPLTAILAGPRPGTSVLDAMSKVCRVLPVGSTIEEGDEETTLRNWLAVLMPLHLPQTTDVTADPMNELSQEIGVPDAFVSELLSAAPRGSDQVQTILYKAVKEPLAEADKDTQS